ncbi:MAG: Cmm like protein [Actinomycetota bacterium]|jgi:alanine racemase
MTSRVHSGRLRRELRLSKSAVEANLSVLGLSPEEARPVIDAVMTFDGLLGLYGTELLLLEKVLGLGTETPAVRLVGELVSVKQVPADTGISYGHLSKTSEPTNLGLVALGFSDGIPRAATNELMVKIQGKAYKNVGRIAMDQLIINLGIDSPSIGSEVELFGDAQTLAQLAGVTGFSPLEIIGRIPARVARTWSD